ncbi:MAG: exosortase system-associated protein, TIGR04073 family [Verrucomicrobiales bacterium]
MKKIAVALLFIALAAPLMADIQAPPKSKQTSAHKLARGLTNIIYGWSELPTSIYRSAELGDPIAEVWVGGIIRGLERTGQRLSYGVYEVVNWRKPLFKETYRPPYTSINYDPINGYEEFPPQIGSLSTVNYARGRSW